MHKFETKYGNFVYAVVSNPSLTDVNNQIVKDSIVNKKDIFRYLEKFYIYPVPTNGNGFDYSIISKFTTIK